MEKKIRILIIGAGPAGLSTLKALVCLESDQKYQVVCIEKQRKWGGQWNFSMETGIDQYGQQIHSGMYSELWTNTPKQCFQFGDYTFKDHFDKPMPSYLPRDLFKGYFMKRFYKYNLYKNIKFNYAAKNVKYIKENKVFEVKLKNLKKNAQQVHIFDYVIVATGHFSIPNIPNLIGQQKFKGKKIHSHDIRQFKQFKNKSILVIGGLLSAEDMTLQTYKYGAKRVIWTYKFLKIPYNTKNLPKNIELIEGFSHLDEHSAYFSNGQKREIDYIIFATGYIHQYPFLEQDLKLKTPRNVTWPSGLYKSIVWQRNPRLLYIGMGNYLMCQTTFDIQAYLARDIITGRFIVPDLSKRDAGDLKRQKQQKQAKSFEDILRSVARYLNELIQITNYPKFNAHDVIPLFLKALDARVTDLVNYRDIGTFKSIFTGEQSRQSKKKWIEFTEVQLDDPHGQEQLKIFLTY